MGLFQRKKASNGKEREQEGEAQESRTQKFLRRPGNTAFKQQRLKAWQPILTPKTVLPTLFIIGILFAPIGGLLIWGASQVSEFTLDYTDCEDQSAAFTEMPSNRWSYAMSGGNGDLIAPQWSFVSDPTNPNVARRSACRITFNVPKTMTAPVFMYYKLGNYYQNHRRYVRSVNVDQMKGQAVAYNSVQGSECKPLDVIGDRIIYPCGLIANSFFNDTFTRPIFLSTTGANTTYDFSERGIAWPGEADKYQQTAYNASQITPPPFWALSYPNGYEDGIPDLHNDEHFHVWMRTAGLPTFRKLYFRNDNDDLQAGTYEVTLFLNYRVRPWGTKALVFSTTSWIGGKNSFLGFSYVATAGLTLLIALGLLIRHLIKPRRLGDMSKLSFVDANAPK